MWVLDIYGAGVNLAQSSSISVINSDETGFQVLAVMEPSSHILSSHDTDAQCRAYIAALVDKLNAPANLQIVQSLEYLRADITDFCVEYIHVMEDIQLQIRRVTP